MFENQDNKPIFTTADISMTELTNIILRNNQVMMDKIDASHAEFLKMFGPKNIEEQKDCSIYPK